MAFHNLLAVPRQAVPRVTVANPVAFHNLLAVPRQAVLRVRVRNPFQSQRKKKESQCRFRICWVGEGPQEEAGMQNCRVGDKRGAHKRKSARIGHLHMPTTNEEDGVGGR